MALTLRPGLLSACPLPQFVVRQIRELARVHGRDVRMVERLL